MFEKIKKSGGWFEEADHTGKAPKHREVAVRGSFKNTMRQPLFSEQPKKDKTDETDDEMEEIIDEVQSRRKETSVAKDSAKTAKKVGEKEDTDDLVDWVKNPEKTDLEDVDTAAEDQDEEEGDEK